MDNGRDQLGTREGIEGHRYYKEKDDAIIDYKEGDCAIIRWVSEFTSLIGYVACGRRVMWGATRDSLSSTNFRP